MFELEEYSSGIHDGFLNKYADSSGTTLDYYISDSLQEMLDVDIRSEVANVVGSAVDYDSCLGELPTSLEQPTETQAMATNKENNSNVTSCWTSSNTFGLGSTNSSSSWFGANGDFFADVGACVNPISVMPLVSASLIHMSPKTNLNANNTRSNNNSTPPPSPNVNDTKSHLTFSPAHIKISAHSIRNEQLTSHIPKHHIVAISSAVTSGTTAPATLATNSLLQRKNSAVEATKKDMGGGDMRKVPVVSVSVSASSSDNHIFKSHSVTASNSSTSNSNTIFTNSSAQPANQQSIATTGNSNTSSSTSTSTIKLGPGIGGLTFANNITTYNKLKQHTTTKLPQGSTIITANGGTMALKRDRESSPLQIASNTISNGGGGQQVTKLLSRNSNQTSSTNFTPKSIASSAHNSYAANQHQINGASNTNSATTNGGQTFTCLTGGIGTFNSNANSSSSSANSNISPNLITIKPLQQKVKAIPVESEFPKPSYSYSCLIAMALKNSRRGSLPVSEIYSFMCEHFPYFKTAPSGWKNSVRHNLSLNKCFEKIEKPPTNGNQRKGCLWAMNPERISKMDEEVLKWSRKDPMAIRNAMVYPENLELLERGEMKHGSSVDSDVEMDSQSEIEEASDLEEPEIDDTLLVDNMVVEEDVEDEMITANSNKSAEVEHEGEICDVVVNRFNKVHRSSSSPATLGNVSNGSTVNNGVATISDSMQRDFDIEVEDIYDAIDIDDDKEAVRMALSQSEIIELSPADYDIGGGGPRENHNSPKRARLNINYSIGPAGEIEKQMKNNQPQMHIQGIKKIVKVSNIQDLQQLQQQLQQQQIIVQTIAGSGHHHQISNGQFTQFSGLSSFNDHQNQRKMQIVNRTS